MWGACLLLFACFSTSAALMAFDTDQVSPQLLKGGDEWYQAVNATAMACMRQLGYSRFIGRLWHSYGAYDDVGAQNIRNAHAAGFDVVDAYLFPCLKASCTHPANQVEAALARLARENTTIGTLWMDIEFFAWEANNTASNRQFISDLVTQTEKMGQKAGIYTEAVEWFYIVGDWEELARLPLWWMQFNYQMDLTSNWTPFAGWSSPTLHQFSDIRPMPCGVDVDESYYL